MSSGFCLFFLPLSHLSFPHFFSLFFFFSLPIFTFLSVYLPIFLFLLASLSISFLFSISLSSHPFSSLVLSPFSPSIFLSPHVYPYLHLPFLSPPLLHLSPLISSPQPLFHLSFSHLSSSSFSLHPIRLSLLHIFLISQPFSHRLGSCFLNIVGDRTQAAPVLQVPSLMTP